MYGNSKNVIAMSQSAILLSVDPIRELTRKLNPAVVDLDSDGDLPHACSGRCVVLVACTGVWRYVCVVAHVGCRRLSGGEGRPPTPHHDGGG